MLRKVKIRHFRGFEDFETPELPQFTVVAGANNVGKSSLLEAIFLMSGMMASNMPERIVDSRLMLVQKSEDILSLFYAQDAGVPLSVEGTFDNDVVRELTLGIEEPEEGAFHRYEEPIPGVDPNTELYPSIKQSYKMRRPGMPTIEGTLSTLVDKAGNIKALSNMGHPESWPCVFIPSRRSLKGVEFLTKLIVEKREQRIVDTLRQIDDRIASIMVNGPKVMVDVGLSRRLPIEVLGDGLIKIVMALSAADACRNGGLICLDEIENGLHYSAMSAFWRSLVSFAKSENIQVIVTTHNLEMLQRIAAETSTADEEILKFVRLERSRDDRIVFTELSGSAYKAQLDEGMELR